MELSCVASSRSRLSLPIASCSPPSSTFSSGSGCSWLPERRKYWAGWSPIKASAEGSRHPLRAAGCRAMDVSATPEPRSSGNSSASTTIVERSLIAGGGDKLGTIFKLSYGIGVYGAMALAGKFICSVTGIDCTGGFDPSTEAILGGIAYAAPPAMALLFILDDEVVKYSPQARAVRDVEDEELRSFFFGMSPLQYLLILAASSIGEELFYRVAIQGALTEMFLRDIGLMKDAHGIASLTGILPIFVPFAQALAAVVAAVLTGALYYLSTGPKDSTYVIAPDLSSGSGHEDIKKLFAARNEKRQMKKIYSPLLEGLLSLYLGFVWIKMHNILAPMITHGIYSTVSIVRGLCKIHNGENNNIQ